MTGGGVMNRRRFLEALAAVGVVVACGPTATPSPSPSSAGVSPAPKPVSIEWWRRNYAAGTQSAETITSDAAVKAYKDRAANVTIAIQGGPFGAETAQKFDIAILQAHNGSDVSHTTGGDDVGAVMGLQDRDVELLVGLSAKGPALDRDRH